MRSIGSAVQRFAEGQVGTTRHDEQDGVIESTASS
jgi:hypothetical protein